MFHIAHLGFPFRRCMRTPRDLQANLFSLALEEVVLKKNHKWPRKFDTKSLDQGQGNQDGQCESTHRANIDTDHAAVNPAPVISLSQKEYIRSSLTLRKSSLSSSKEAWSIGFGASLAIGSGEE